MYLGGTISADSNCDKHVMRRIKLAAGIVRKLQTIWNADNISKKTKVCFYQSLVQSLLLYNSETWTLKEKHKQKLEVFEMSILRKILGVTRRNRWKNVDIMKALDIDSNIPYIAVFGCTEGSRTRGRPMKNGWTTSRKTVQL